MKRYFPLLIIFPVLMGMARTPYYKKPYALRTIPDYYVANRPYTIQVQVYPSSMTGAYAIEEVPPQTWSISMSTASYGGVYDTINHKFKWLFFDGIQRNLTYTVIPSTALTGYTIQTITGLGSFDGYNYQTKGSTLAYPITIPTPDPDN